MLIAPLSHTRTSVQAMRPAQHDSRDRLTIAALSGTVQRLAVEVMRGDFDYPPMVAELHSISTDPHLLAHATVDRDHWMHAAVEALLLLAGANQRDLDDMAAGKRA